MIPVSHAINQPAQKSIGLRIYEVWFSVMKRIVEFFNRQISPALGATFGLIALEGHTLVRAGWHTFKKYRNPAETYGFNSINPNAQIGSRPVLLIHGAAGSWNYMGDLATSLRSRNISVFVIDLGTGQPTDAKRQAILEKITTIQELYRTQFNTPDTIPVDLVSHSMGGNVAVASAFSTENSSFNNEGDLTFTSNPIANPNIGKIVTLALPSNATEVNWFRQAAKVDDLFNINAKYDALMGHKRCAVENPVEIDAGHIGIVYQAPAQEAVANILQA